VTTLRDCLSLRLRNVRSSEGMPTPERRAARAPQSARQQGVSRRLDTRSPARTAAHDAKLSRHG
jgi:hypothetical protein